MTDPKLKCDLCGNPRSWHEGKNTVRRGVHAFVMPSDDKSARMLAELEARAAVHGMKVTSPEVIGTPTTLDAARSTAFAAMNLVLGWKVGGEEQPMTDLEPVDQAILEQLTEAIHLYGTWRVELAMSGSDPAEED